MDLELLSVTSDDSVSERVGIKVSVELDNLVIPEEHRNILFQGRIERFSRILRHGTLSKDAKGMVVEWLKASW